MFIELTDHLRCPEDHPESFLVLLPDEVRERRVISGTLGCPVCGRVVPVADGRVDFGGGDQAAPGHPDTGLGAEGVAVLLALSGPGGYVALVGAVGGIVERLAPLLEGIGIVLVNPPRCTTGENAAGVFSAGRLPLKSSCLRGIVLSAAFARPDWVEAAARALLPGYRIVVEGGEAPVEFVEELARSPQAWVGVRKKREP